MLINPANIDLATKGFKTVYSDAYLKAEVAWDKLAMTVDSSSRDETYGWMGLMPQLREWPDLTKPGLAHSAKPVRAKVHDHQPQI